MKFIHFSRWKKREKDNYRFLPLALKQATKFQCLLNEEVLQALVRQVDAELLKAVRWHSLEAVDIEDAQVAGGIGRRVFFAMVVDARHYPREQARIPR